MREINPRFHNHGALWSDEENEILIRMWKKGHTYNLHGTAFMKAFDKEWHGPVPLKHWAITKRWGA